MTLAAASLVSCTGGGGGPAATDTTPPVVLSSAPAAGSVGVAAGTTITATFSESMKGPTLTTASFLVTGPGGSISGTVAAAGAAATFTPTSGLASATTYTARITTAAQDLAGNGLAADHVWSFTTADTTPPTVLSTLPASGATGVALDGLVTVTFSEPMLASSIDATSLRLSEGGSAITGTVGVAGAVATFTPAAPLTAGRTYTATVTTLARDLAGNGLAADHAWSFTTVAAPSGVRILYARYADLISMFEDGSGAVSLSSGAAYRGVSPAGKVVYFRSPPGYTALLSSNADGTGGAVLATVASGLGFLEFSGFSSNERVVYRWGGDLYAVNLDGTGTSTLANSADDEGAAVMAPGGRVVYLRTSPLTGDQSLYSVKDDGTGEVLLDGTIGAKIIGLVSAAGRVFYSRYGDRGQPGVYAIDTDGSGFATIVSTPGYAEGFAGLAPDGTVMVDSCLEPYCGSTLLSIGGGPRIDLGTGRLRGITSNNRVIVEQGPLGGWDVMAYPTSGGGPVALAADPAWPEYFQAICPDDRVVYGKPGGGAGLYSVRPDGTGTVTLAASAAIEVFLGVTSAGRVVSGTEAGALTAISSVNCDGTDPRTLVASASGMSYLGLSSSGKVLYLGFDVTGLESDLYIVGHDGGAPLNLTGNPSISTTSFFRSVP
jgi:hypothetical protein